MGTATYVRWMELDVVDPEGFVEFLNTKDFEKHLKENENYESFVREVATLKNRMEDTLEDYKEINGDRPLKERLDTHLADILFNELKIIGYWYEGYCIALREISQFVEGRVELEDEFGQEYARLDFYNGEVRIAQGVIEFGKEHSIEEFAGIKPLPDGVKMLRKV